MKQATIQLETLTCPSCLQKIEKAVNRLDGVDSDTLKVLFNSSKVKFDFDEEKIKIEQVEQAIDQLGYQVLKTRVR
ncbi:MAG TPA: heavy-metal-associated domain-containing protein [Erysipelothrix sp.]|nr:heavy-metal-associated domain-containing protein [Erysipelothrix sp.]